MNHEAPGSSGAAHGETREELSRRLNNLYFGQPCCCGGNVYPELGLLALLRHIYHALRCRVGLCIWRSKV